MVDASIASTQASNPNTTANVHFDPSTQSFFDQWGERLDDEGVSGMLGYDGRTPGLGAGGNTTLRRNALFRALLSSVGARTQFLEQLHRQQDSGSEGVGSLKKAFYARGANADLIPLLRAVTPAGTGRDYQRIGLGDELGSVLD